MPQAVRFNARLSSDGRRPDAARPLSWWKRPRLWVDAGLALLVIALGAWIYYGGGATSSGANKNRLTDLDPDQVKKLVLTRPEQAVIELERSGDGWMLKSGSASVPASSLRVRTLLDLISAPVLSHYPVKSLKLSDAGLVTPKLTLVADGLRLQLGEVNPYTQRRYVMIGDEVKLVQDNYFDLFTSGSEDYAATRLAPADWKLRKLSLPGGLTLNTDASGHWAVEGSATLPDKVKPEDVADSWQNASALAVSASSDDEALQEVVMQFDGGHELRYLVVAEEPELVLARADAKLAYHFGPEQARQLLARPDPLSVTAPAAAAAQPAASPVQAVEKTAPAPGAAAAAAEAKPGAKAEAKPSSGTDAPSKAETKPVAEPAKSGRKTGKPSTKKSSRKAKEGAAAGESQKPALQAEGAAAEVPEANGQAKTETKASGRTTKKSSSRKSSTQEKRSSSSSSIRKSEASSAPAPAETGKTKSSERSSKDSADNRPGASSGG